MAVENVFDATTSWVADIDPGPRKILAHRYPGVPNLGDVTRVDWSQVEPVDIIAGGYPCQPFSQAGRRQGQADDRHLWPNVADILAIIRPRIVVFENVRGHLTLGFDEVVRDLHQLGYDIQWTLLRASDIGACHQRARLFILGVEREQRVCRWSGASGSGPECSRVGRGGPAAHPGDGADGALPLGGVVGTGGKPVRTDSVRGPIPGERNDGGGTRLRPDLTLLPTPGANLGHNGGPQDPDKRRAGGHSVSIEDAVHGLRLLPTIRTKDNENRQSAGYGGKDGNFHGLLTGQSSWGDYAAAIHRHERMLGRPAPCPTEPGAKRLNRHGNPRVNPRLSPRFVEWMMGLSDGWVTDTPGITRNEALKALGNGVVPQQCEAALEHMLNRIEAA